MNSLLCDDCRACLQRDLNDESYHTSQPVADLLVRQHSCDLCRLVASKLDIVLSTTKDKIVSVSMRSNTSLTDIYQSGGGLDDVRRYAHVPPRGKIEFQTEYLLNDRQRFSLTPFMVLRTSEALIPKTSDFDSMRDADVEDYNTRMLLCSRLSAEQIQPSLLSQWIRICDTRHSTCGAQKRKPALRPSHMLDVQRGCVVETPEGCRYLVLSYVWGDSPIRKHVRSNSTWLRTPGTIPNDHMPSTIRDAVALTRTLGETYLWVDALCIVQDDSASLQAQIGIMGHVYANAVCTIAAAFGDSADSGLPGIRKGTRVTSQDVIRCAGRTWIPKADRVDVSKKITGSRWESRGWTFQERMLSSKMIIFTEDQVHWTCKEGSFTEDVCLEGIESTVLEGDTYFNESLSIPEGASASNYASIYQYALVNYAQRSIRYTSDRLLAYTGVLEAITASQDDVGIWGLPESIFSACITWKSGGGLKRKVSKIPIMTATGIGHDVLVPSWSWAAWSNDQGTIPGINPHVTTPFGLLVIFYRCDLEGHLLRIKERLDLPTPKTTADAGNAFERLDQYTSNVLASSESSPDAVGRSTKRILVTHFRNRSAWQGQDTLAESSEFGVDSGLLKFWSSVARVRLRPFPQDGEWAFAPVLAYGFDESVEIRLDDSLPPYSDTPYEAIQNIEWADSTGLQVELNLVVISLTTPLCRHGREVHLLLLIVEWSEGVAYRMGTGEISERDWIKIHNREWRLITMG